jgi:hypothetical protein
MKKKIKEVQELRKVHVKKIRIKILKIKEHQSHQKFQKMLLMKIKNKPVRILQIKMIFKTNRFQLIVFRITDPIDNKSQIIRKMMDNRLVNSSI